MKHRSVSYDINLIPSQQMAMQDLNIASVSQDDVCNYVAKAEDTSSLEALAKAEAARILQSGDTSRYKEVLKKNGVLMNGIEE